MESIFKTINSIKERLPQDMRVRWGLGAGASMLLSAGVLGLGGSFTPQFLHASGEPRPIIPQERTEARGLEVVDMSTSTVFQVIESLPKAERYELMLYNTGADEALKERGVYTAFVPSSADFDYLPRGYISGLSRTKAKELALSHIASRAIPPEEELNGNLITLGDTAVSFEVDAEADTVTVGGAKVTKVYKALNGYVYIINKVLVETE